jgi:excisionase family DNA binding protein
MSRKSPGSITAPSSDNTGQVQHLTAEDVAARLQIPRWSIYELVKRGDLPHLRIGKRLRFRLADLERWEIRQVRGESERGQEEP